MGIRQDGEAWALEPLASRRNPYIGNRAHGPAPGVGEKVLWLCFSTHLHEDSPGDSPTLCVEPNGRFPATPTRSSPAVTDGRDKSTLADRKETAMDHRAATARPSPAHLPALSSCVFSPEGYSGVGGAGCRAARTAAGSFPGHGREHTVRHGRTRERQGPSPVGMAPALPPCG